MTQEIIKKIDEANQKLDTMLQWKAGFEQRCIAHRDQTDEVRSVLFDNPNGLVKRVSNLNHCKDELSRWRDFWMYVLKILVVTCIISLAAWLLFIYRGH